MLYCFDIYCMLKKTVPVHEAPALGLRLCANESYEKYANGTGGANTSEPKSDLHLLGGTYHFSGLMCLHPDAIFTVITRFILT